MRRFANGVRFLHRFHRDLQIRQIIERIEDAENIHAGRSGVLDESGDDIVRIIRIADRIRAAEKHLETDVRNAPRAAGAGVPTDLPAENASRCRTSRRPTSPARTARVERTEPTRQRRSTRQHVVGAHARGHQRLMRVAKSRVGDEQPLLLQRPFGKFLRAQAPAADRACLGDGRLRIVSTEAWHGSNAFAGL